jgi:hypothetical protein
MPGSHYRTYTTSSEYRDAEHRKPEYFLSIRLTTPCTSTKYGEIKPGLQPNTYNRIDEQF